MSDQSIRIIIEAQNKASSELAALNKQVGSLSSSFQGARDEMAKTEGRLASLRGGFSGVGGALQGILAGGAIAALGTQVFNLVDNLEKNRIAFTTMLGSAEAAEKMLSDLSAFAAKTPFQLTDVRENAKTLMAMGIESENVLSTMKALGDVAAGTGADFTRLAVNLGQVKTQGKLTGAELRDFAVNGVPLIAALADHFGVTKDQIKDMVSEGKVGFSDVEQAFENMTSAGGMFEDMMEQQSSTIGGMISNIIDSWEQLLETVADTSAFQVLKELVAEFASFAEGADQAKDSVNNTMAAVTSAILVFINGFNAIKTVIGSIGKVIGAAGAAIALVLKGEFEAAGDVINNVGDEIGGDMVDLTKGIEQNNKRIVKAWQPLEKETKKVSTNVVTSIKEVQKASGGMSKETAKSLENTEKKYKQMMEKASESLEKLRKKHADSVDKIKKKNKDLQDDLRGSAFSIGEAVVEQEEKVKEIQAQIMEKGAAGESTFDLVKQLEKEKKSLEEARRVIAEDSGLQQGLEGARAAEEIGAFGTFLEQSLLKRDALKEEIAQNNASLAAEQAVFAAKEKVLLDAGAQFQQFNADGTLAMDNLAANTAMSVDKMVADIERLKTAMASVSATGFSGASVSAPMASNTNTTSNTTNNSTNITNNISGAGSPSAVASAIERQTARKMQLERLASA